MSGIKRKVEESDINMLTNEISNFNINVTSVNAVIYSRVSSKSQADSLPVQKQVLTNYCITNNFKIVESVEDVQSAFKNPELLSINDIVDRYNNINIIIKAPCRMMRDIEMGSRLIKNCIKKNILIHVVDHNFICNSTLNAKRLLCGMYDAMNESETLSKRLKSHNLVKKNMGAYFGTIPYGMESYMEIVNNVPIRKIRNLPLDHIESKIIDLIDMMYCGTVSDKFYSLFNSLHSFPDKLGGDKFKFTDYKNKEYNDNDFAKGFTISTIVNLLNDWKILKNNKEWSIDMLNNVIDRHINL
jgi:DNA invertase Pin-like site-specific DNA recombinase